MKTIAIVAFVVVFSAAEVNERILCYERSASNETRIKTNNFAHSFDLACLCWAWKLHAAMCTRKQTRERSNAFSFLFRSLLCEKLQC